MPAGSTIAQLITAAGGLAVFASIVTSWATRRKINREASKADAEASAIYVKAAADLMAPLQNENQRLSDKVDLLTRKVEELTEKNAILLTEVRNLRDRLAVYETQ